MAIHLKERRIFMGFSDESGNGMVMPVSPMYGNGNGFGQNGDWAW